MTEPATESSVSDRRLRNKSYLQADVELGVHGGCCESFAVFRISDRKLAEERHLPEDSVVGVTLAF